MPLSLSCSCSGQLMGHQMITEVSFIIRKLNHFIFLNTVYIVTSALRLEKRVFREGRNTLAMAVFGVRASQIQTTCLLNIRM